MNFIKENSKKLLIAGGLFMTTGGLAYLIKRIKTK